MKKKGFITLKALMGIIIGIMIVLLLVGLTIKLLPFQNKNLCPNNVYWDEIEKALEELDEEGTIKDVFFSNEGCYLVGFSKKLGEKIIAPKEYEENSVAFCLCNIKEDLCKSQGNCYTFKSVNEILDMDIKENNQYNTKNYKYQYLFIKFAKKENKLFVYTTPRRNKESMEEIKEINEIDVETLSSIMKYAQKNSVVNAKCNCGEKCEEYAEYLIKYSKEYSLPGPLLALSIMMQETNCEPPEPICIWDNNQYSCGLMMVNKKDFTSRKEDFKDPEIQIRAGIRHLRDKYDNYIDNVNIECYDYPSKWEKAVHAYNGLLCTNKDYPMDVMDRFKKLKEISENLLALK